MHMYMFLLDCGVTQTLPMEVLSHMQYLEQELRIEGLSFPFDLEVCWLSWCVGTCIRSGAHALILAFTVQYICIYMCIRTYIRMCVSGTLTCSTETKWYTTCSSKGSMY